MSRSTSATVTPRERCRPGGEAVVAGDEVGEPVERIDVDKQLRRVGVHRVQQLGDAGRVEAVVAGSRGPLCAELGHGRLELLGLPGGVGRDLRGRW